MKLNILYNSHKNPSTSPKNFSGISGEVFQRNTEEFRGEKVTKNFSKLNLKNVIPQNSLILGSNSGEFFENLQGTSYRK